MPKPNPDDALAITETIKSAAAFARDLDELAPFWPPSGQAAKICRETREFVGEALTAWSFCGALDGLPRPAPQAPQRGQDGSE